MPTNEKKKLVNTDDKSTLSEKNTNVNDNPEEMKNLKTVENTRQTTQTQILTKPAERIILYNTNKTPSKANLLTTKFSASQVY